MSIFRTPMDREGDNGRFGDSALPRTESSASEAPAARPEFVMEPRGTDTTRSTSPTPAPTPPPASPLADYRPEREVRPQATDPEKCTNVIAASSKWSGSLNVDDSVRVEGQVSGEIVAKGTVHISEGARVDAKVRAAFVVISGSFKGEIRCSERLELLPKSRVEGSLHTKVLNVHEGALVDGTIEMQAERLGTKEAPAEPERTTSRSRAATSA